MPRHSRTASVSPILHARIAAALAEVDSSRARLAEVVGADAPHQERRAAYVRVSAAFADADRLLRDVTKAARPGPYRVWRQWRHRLSQLDMAKQIHLLAENDAQVLGIGSVRAVDTGMLGPDVGDHLHGECSAPGAPARYGLDLELRLTDPAQLVVTPTPPVVPGPHPAEQPQPPQQEQVVATAA